MAEMEIETMVDSDYHINQELLTAVENVKVESTELADNSLLNYINQSIDLSDNIKTEIIGDEDNVEMKLAVTFDNDIDVPSDDSNVKYDILTDDDIKNDEGGRVINDLSVKLESVEGELDGDDSWNEPKCLNGSKYPSEDNLNSLTTTTDASSWCHETTDNSVTQITYNCETCDADLPTYRDFVEHLSKCQATPRNSSKRKLPSDNIVEEMCAKKIYNPSLDFNNAVSPAYENDFHRGEEFLELETTTSLMKCLTCQQIFQNQTDLTAHMNQIHLLYPCGYCSEKFSTKNALFLHGREHLQCRTCNTVFTSRAKVAEHMSTEHRIHLCLECDAIRKTKTFLENHMRKYHYICLECNQKSSDINELIQHEKEIHCIFTCTQCCNRFTGVTKFQEHTESCCFCSNCKIVFQSKEDLTAHEENVHTKTTNGQCVLSANSSRSLEFQATTNLIKCLKCPQKFQNQTALTAHMNHLHLQCYSCHKVFSSKATVASHMAKEHRIYLCLECDVIRRTKTLLDNHMRKDHYICLECNKKSPDINELIQHEQEIHSIFTCTQCCKRFTGITKFQKHKESCYFCSTCKIVFQSKRDLTAHEENVHTKTTNDQCVLSANSSRVANKTFDSDFTETPQRKPPSAQAYYPYSCNICRSFFTNDQHLSIHMNVRHLRFACELCFARFATDIELLQHRGKNHVFCENCRYWCSNKAKLSAHSANAHSIF